MHHLWNYRVNFGQGTVSELFPTQADAYHHLETVLTQYGSTGGMFVQKRIDGEWFAVASKEVRS